MPTSMVAAETLPPTQLRKHMKLWEKLNNIELKHNMHFLMKTNPISYGWELTY